MQFSIQKDITLRYTESEGPTTAMGVCFCSLDQRNKKPRNLNNYIVFSQILQVESSSHHPIQFLLTT